MFEPSGVRKVRTGWSSKYSKQFQKVEFEKFEFEKFEVEKFQLFQVR